MADFSEIPWIAEHIRLYRTDPEKARLWDSTPLGGPGLLKTLLLTTKGRKSGKPKTCLSESWIEVMYGVLAKERLRSISNSLATDKPCARALALIQVIVAHRHAG